MPARDPKSVAIVVLAAGSSTRMGQNKLLLELDGETLVRRAVRRALGVGAGSVIAVVGHEAERVRAELHDLSCEIVVNPDHALGMRTSLQAGIARIREHAGAALILLADMPYVSQAMMRGLIERYGAGQEPLVISRYGEVKAPPMLYDRALFEELLALGENRCAKYVVKRHEHEAASVSWPESALRDIDVVEDYERALGERGEG
jgi:molybdenum cofactor cytidylyltransferase